MHCPAKQGALAWRQLRVYGVLNEHRRRQFNRRRADVPAVAVEGIVYRYSRFCFRTLWAQRFGKVALRALISSCTQLLERIGSNARISEPAATTMLKIAMFSGVMAKSSL